jgi:AcrR family transcriptional regulator
LAKGARLRGDETRARIKVAAQRLFAQRGVDGVTVRDIVAAAGQRNNGSLNYYFRTKEALVLELIVEGGHLIDESRNAYLDRLEAAGGPRTVREVIEALVYPAIGLAEADREENTYIRFITMLELNHRKLFRGLFDRKSSKTWNSGYRRCLQHLGRLTPDLPQVLLNQRLVFLGVFLNASLSVREAALEQGKQPHHFWGADHTLPNLIDAMQAIIEAPSSRGTMSTFAAAPVAPSRGKKSDLSPAEADK